MTPCHSTAVSEFQEGADVGIAAGVFLARLAQGGDPADFKQEHEIRGGTLVDADSDLVVLLDQQIARDPGVAAGGFQSRRFLGRGDLTQSARDRKCRWTLLRR